MRKRRKLKNIILKGFIGFTFAVFTLSVCALDSECWELMLAVCSVSFAILAMFAYANGAMGGN